MEHIVRINVRYKVRISMYLPIPPEPLGSSEAALLHGSLNDCSLLPSLQSRGVFLPTKYDTSVIN